MDRAGECPRWSMAEYFVKNGYSGRPNLQSKAIPLRFFLSSRMFSRLTRYLRSGPFLFGALGGLLFLLVFQLKYNGIDPGAYQYRDDGIITLSHAKNFIDHGHIGVEPSGKRLEGFSAPAQFWIYTVVYGLTGLHWLDFATIQTLLCTFLLGFFFMQFFRGKWMPGLVIAGLAAWLLSQHLRFLEWHGSGMENAWTHVLFLAAVWCCWEMLRREQVHYGWVVWLFLASISRTESIFHIAPMLFLFGVVWKGDRRSWKGFHLLGVTLGAWGLYQCWRFWYFGSWVPNSGLAQEIGVGGNLRRALEGDAAWLKLAGGWSKELFRLHGGWLLLGGLLLVPFAKIERREKWLLIAVASLTLTAFLNPVVFGMTRLDVTRSTTFLAVFVVLGLAMVIPRLRFSGMNLAALPLIIGLLLAGHFLRPQLFEDQRHLCCAVDNFRDLDYHATQFSETHHLHRLNIANPDLGKFSYLKKYNHTDLGFLGSPLLAHLRAQPDLLREYFYGFILPDMVEVHGEWCLLHARILADARFRNLYEPLHETRVDYLEQFGGAWPTVTEGLFQRKSLKNDSESRERMLIQGMQEELSLDWLREELERSVDLLDPRAHQYVLRTAYRFLPEFEDAGLADELVDLFRETPSAVYDVAILESGGSRNWVESALGFLEPWLESERGAFFEGLVGEMPEQVVEMERWRLYRASGNRLVISVLAPTTAEQQRQFMLHSFDADKEAAKKKNQWGADFMDFSWDADCWTERNGEFFTVVDLPPGDLEAVIVGQVSGDRRHWTKRVDWGGRF